MGDPRAAPPPYAARAEQVRASRQKVLDAARDLFLRRGYFCATIEAIVDKIENERAIGTQGMARHIATRFGLRPGLTEAEAADVLWTLTSPEVADRLTRRPAGPLRAPARPDDGGRAGRPGVAVRTRRARRWRGSSRTRCRTSSTS